MPADASRQVIACCLAALSLAAAGCGGDDSKEADFGTSSATT